MASTIDMSKFDFYGDLIDSMSQTIMDEFIKSPSISEYATVYPDIKVDKQIGFIGSGGLVGKLDQGCDPTAHDYSIAGRMLQWTPTDFEVLIHACYTDLASTVASYSLKTGTRKPDFTDGDYMNIVRTVLLRSMEDMAVRYAWFIDTAADVIANGGVLTAGTDKTYFNMNNGFFQQMETQVTSNADQLVTITENAGDSYVLQALPSTAVQAYLQSLVFGADTRLRDMDNQGIWCTQSFYDAYAKSLQGTGLESLYTNLVDGQKTLTYNGIPLYPMKKWDQIIKAYENNGTTYNNPHRAVYTSKDVLGFGVGSMDSLDSFDVWYDKDSRKVKIEALGSFDIKLMNPELFMIATGAVGS